MNELLYIYTGGGDIILFLNHDDKSAAVFNYPEYREDVSPEDQVKAVEDCSSWEAVSYIKTLEWLEEDDDAEILYRMDTDINDCFNYNEEE